MTIQDDKKRKNKGGRPKATIKRDASITVMCNLIEKKLIQVNAKKVGTNASVYLRELGLSGTVKLKLKTLPKEVLQFTGTMNHMAANLNQIARKRNSGEDLNAVDRALLNQEVRSLQQVVEEVKGYLK
jgi:mobilization protein NikA